MADGKIVGLDIGTNEIRVAIGEVDPDTGDIIRQFDSIRTAHQKTGISYLLHNVIPKYCRA